MFDLISIGGISIDLYFKGNSLTYSDDRFQLAIGGKYLADHFYAGVGGGGTNIAIGAAKHGLKVALMGKIGNNIFKKTILDTLSKHNIFHSLCDIENDYFNVSAILLSAGGERSVIHYMTPHQHLFNEINELKGITKTKMVFLGNLPDVPLEERSQFLHFLNKKGITTIVNLGVKDCRRSVEQLKRLLQCVDILILNGHEFAEMVKAPYKDIHFRSNVIDWYIPQLSDKLVVVTEGANGSYAYYKDEIYNQSAEPLEKIIDSTGAGDGFTADFISQYQKTGDILSSLKIGSVYAAKILCKVGAN